MSEVEIQVECRTCGRSLDVWSLALGIIEVEPCEKCLGDANSDGYRQALDEHDKATE